MGKLNINNPLKDKLSSKNINNFLSDTFDTDLGELKDLGSDAGMAALNIGSTMTGVGLLGEMITGRSASDLMGYDQKTNLGKKVDKIYDTKTQVMKKIAPMAAGVAGAAFGVPPGLSSAAMSGLQAAANPLVANNVDPLDPSTEQLGNTIGSVTGALGSMAPMLMKHGGTIHIDPKNKGKFNATKKATGKTTEELTHSKNPLTRKRAIFAQNAAHWKHAEGGGLPNSLGQYEEYEGPSHANGGIPVMIDQQGNTHEVEGGEVSHTLSNGEKYVYSKDFGTAQKMKRAQAKYTGKRPADKLSKEVEQQKADKLASLNETMKQEQQSKDLMKLNKAYGKYIMKYGGKIKYNVGDKMPEDGTDYSNLNLNSDYTFDNNGNIITTLDLLDVQEPTFISKTRNKSNPISTWNKNPEVVNNKFSKPEDYKSPGINPSMTDYQKWNVGLGAAGAALPAAYNLYMGTKKPELLNAADYQTNQDFGFNNLQWEDIDASPLLRDVDQTETASRYMASQMGLDPTAAANIGRQGKLDAVYKKGAIKSDISNKNKMGRLETNKTNLAALQNKQAREYQQKTGNAAIGLQVNDINSQRKGRQQAFTSAGIGQLGAGMQQTAGTIGKVGQEQDILGMLPEIYNNPQFQKFFQSYLAAVKP